MGTRHYKRIEVGNYDIPVEALRIAEDIVRLEQICRLLDEIDPANCSQDKGVGLDSWKMMRSMARLCKMAATRKLREEFLRKG